MRQTARHDVVFVAGTAGEHELTWSQKAHEREGCHPRLHGPRNRNVRMGRALDGRPDMSAVLHAFAAVMAHFEALRTLYPRDADGHPRAVVVASGVLQIDEYASARSASGRCRVPRLPKPRSMKFTSAGRPPGGGRATKVAEWPAP
jgi:hypothetical protein